MPSLPGFRDCQVDSWFAVPQCKVCSVCAATDTASCRSWQIWANIVSCAMRHFAHNHCSSMQHGQGFSPTVKAGGCVICREDPEVGPTVAGLSKVKVDSVDTIFALLQVNSSIQLPTPSPLHSLTFSISCLLAHLLTNSCTHPLTCLVNPLGPPRTCSQTHPFRPSLFLDERLLRSAMTT